MINLHGHIMPWETSSTRIYIIMKRKKHEYETIGRYFLYSSQPT
jgi:hypothetical protein